jgi:hypothetical protein
MTALFLPLLTGRNPPKIQQPRESQPSIINEKTIADFTRVVERTGISKAGIQLARRAEAEGEGGKRRKDDDSRSVELRLFWNDLGDPTKAGAFRFKGRHRHANRGPTRSLDLRCLQGISLSPKHP